MLVAAASAARWTLVCCWSRPATGGTGQLAGLPASRAIGESLFAREGRLGNHTGEAEARHGWSAGRGGVILSSSCDAMQ